MGVSVFTSCDDLNEPILLTNEDKFVAFLNTSQGIAENNGEKVGILVYVSAVSGSGCSVDFDFSTEGIDLPAVEGTDYNLINDSKTLTFDNYFGYDTIWIEPIDNGLVDLNKKFNITLTAASNSFDLGREKTILVTIVDDEHPLKAWLGSYAAAAASQGDPGNWDEAWSITTEAVEGDLNSISIHGVAGSADGIIASIDKDALTITIQPGQTIDNYSYGNYGPIGIYWGNYPDVTIDKPIEGTVSLDGTIYLPNFGEMFVNETNYGIVWDVFNVTLTPAKGETEIMYPLIKDINNR